MSFKLKKRGDINHLNKHNYLDNINLPDQHPIETIIDLTDKLNNINENIDIMFNKIYNGDIGMSSGIISRPRYNKKITYKNNLLIQEEFTGEINKTITYEYNSNGHVIKKTVTRADNKQFISSFIYDDEGRLIEVNDNGTEEEYVHTTGGIPSYISINGHTSSSSNLIMVCDFNEVFKNEDLATIINSELIITNKGSSMSRVVIKKDNITILESAVVGSDTQKYILGINKSIQVYIVGDSTYDITISGIKNDHRSVSGLSPNAIKFLKDVSMYISDMQLRYDTILCNTHNTDESFTDLMQDDTNIEYASNYVLKEE